MSVPRLALALSLLTAVAACAPTRSARPRSSQVGQKLVLAAPDLSGRELDTAVDTGKVRVVDFWASWCEPCRDALPHLQSLADELGPRGLVVYTVSFDEDPDQVTQFLKQVPLTLPVLWDRGGDRLSARFEVTRLPTTIVADRAGVIRWVQDGWSTAKARETRREIERLLDEP